MPKNPIWDTSFIFLCLVFKYVVPLIYWEPMVPIPSFARKDFQSFLLVPSLRSGRRQTVFHLSNLRFSNEETDFVV